MAELKCIGGANDGNHIDVPEFVKAGDCVPFDDHVYVVRSLNRIKHHCKRSIVYYLAPKEVG